MPDTDKFKSHIFSIEEKDREAAVPGFIIEKVDTTLIHDGFKAKDRESLNKMCTSIPTPFARLFLFRTAFMEIHKSEDSNENKGKRKKHRADGLYNYLVSDCLDMLEFIFYYGDHHNFNVIEWNCGPELDKLTKTGREGHELLHNALKDHLSNDKVLSKMRTIYLFTWNDDPDNENSVPVVIGGTSPFSLVYTSPNWVREKNSRGWTFRAGKGGRNLFDNNPTSIDPPVALCDRSERFKKYIYKMFFAFRRNHQSLFDFEKYIQQSWEYYDRDTKFGQSIAGIETSYDISRFKKDYPDALNHISIKNGHASQDKKEAIVIGDGDAAYAIPLRCMSLNLTTAHDDYQIRSRRIPMEKSGSNAEKTIETPLVLDPDVELAGALYFEDEPWSSFRNMMPAWGAENPNYWERTLPGTNKPYPYLRKEDLLEDKIIGLAGNIAGKYFLTGNTGEVAYLPPIKRNFFKYFGIDDLYRTNDKGIIELDDNGMPRVNQELYLFEDNNDGSVTVTLRIPVKFNNEYIELRKTYYEENIVFFDDADAGRNFNLSIFPFYKIVGDESKYNKYNVMLGYKGDIKLHFYKLSDMNKELIDDKVNNQTVKIVENKPRTASNAIDTRFYTVNSDFDIIEVEAGGCHGIVLPLFKQVELGTKTMVFCVDFGTTNTHIAYAVDSGNTVNEPEDFSYSEDDMQVVSLFDIGSYMNYKTTMKREFVPEVIFTDSGSGSISNSRLSFPIRTTACVSEKWLGNNNTTEYNLFGDSNVGFYYLNEDQSDKSGNVYKHNIKWAKTDKIAKLRNSFFDEIMWMLKNKAVLNGCSMNFYFYFTYPQSMEGLEIDNLYNLWSEARRNVNAGDPAQFNMNENDPTHPVESIVPWCYHRKGGEVEDSEVYMNVDIGGGTMDIVYYDPDRDESYTYSARFAANDLWGDGLDDQSANRKNNSFLKGYATTLNDLASSLIDRYHTFSSNAEDSSDIISFLFKYDKDYHFSEYLKRSPQITLLLMHVAAVAYYIGLILKKDGLIVPRKLAFTGMGSLYLNIISPKEKDLADIFKSVLRYQGLPEDEIERLEVVLTPNPKVVTARGGVAFHRNKKLSQVESTVWGYDGESDLDTLEKKDVLDKMDDVMALVEDYIEYFNSPEFSDMKSALNRGWDYRPLDKGTIMDIAKTSFKSWNKSNNKGGKEKQKDPIFFWPFKDLLFKYGFKIE